MSNTVASVFSLNRPIFVDFQPCEVGGVNFGQQHLVDWGAPSGKV